MLPVVVDTGTVWPHAALIAVVQSSVIFVPTSDSVMIFQAEGQSPKPKSNHASMHCTPDVTSPCLACERNTLPLAPCLLLTTVSADPYLSQAGLFMKAE